MARSQLIKSVLTTGSATVVRHVHSDDRTRRELVTLQFHVSPVPQRRTYDRRVCSGTAALLLPRRPSSPLPPPQAASGLTPMQLSHSSVVSGGKHQVKGTTCFASISCSDRGGQSVCSSKHVTAATACSLEPLARHCSDSVSATWLQGSYFSLSYLLRVGRNREKPRTKTRSTCDMAFERLAGYLWTTTSPLWRRPALGPRKQPQPQPQTQNRP